MFRQISAFSKISSLAHIHPLEKIMLSIFPIVILGYCKSYIPQIINVAIFIFLHWRSKNPSNIVVKFTLGTAIFALISSITFLFDYGLYASGIIVLKALNGGLCLSYLALTTPVDHILLIGSKISYLRDICDIAKNMERFIFLIEDEYQVLFNAAKCRGGFSGFKDKIMDTSKIAGLLLVNTLKRWREINDAVNARCYKGYMVYLQNEFSFSKNRVALSVSYSTFLIIIIYLN
jgi:cobalt/nickel transport system permease protein